MQFDQPPIPSTLTLSMSFEDGVMAVFYAHAPPVKLGAKLGYKMNKDEARKLAAALTAWADAQP
jgi:hypothetical protein